MSRWPLLFVCIGLVVAGVAYDQVSVDEATAVVSQAESDPIVSPSVNVTPSLNAAWYCAVGSSDPTGFADHTVNISNFAEEVAVANLTVLTEDGPRGGRRIELAPRTTARVKLSEIQTEATAGAVVEATGGAVVVGHTVETSQGAASGPCATHVSNEWYFASGRVGGEDTGDAEYFISLMNPFPESAVFDARFRAVGRTREPGDLQGMVVPPRSVVVVKVGDYVKREEEVATAIRTQRGRLVVERLQVMDGGVGASGAALQLGVPTPANSWLLTAGRLHAEGEHRVTVYNPAIPLPPKLVQGPIGEDGESELVLEETTEGFVYVDIELWPNNPTDIDSFGVVKIEREIRPGDFETIDLLAQASLFDFPLPYELAVSVTSRDGQPVVVERWQMAEKTVREGSTSELAVEEVENPDLPTFFGTSGGVLPQPIATKGISSSRGNEVLSCRWILPWTPIPSSDSTLLSIVAPRETKVEAFVLGQGQLNGPFRTTVPGAGRSNLAIEAPGQDGGAIEVRTESAVSVEAMSVVVGETLQVHSAIPTLDSCVSTESDTESGDGESSDSDSEGDSQTDSSGEPDSNEDGSVVDSSVVDSTAVDGTVEADASDTEGADTPGADNLTPADETETGEPDDGE